MLSRGILNALYTKKRQKYVSTGFRSKPVIKHSNEHSNEKENGGNCICRSLPLRIRHFCTCWQSDILRTSGITCICTG